MSYLLATNVISEFVNPAPNLSVQTWMKDHQWECLFLSVITVCEIQQGITRLPSSPKKNKLQAWLQRNILKEYADYILPVDTDTMLQWGELTGILIQKGRKISVMDSLIAATAIQHHLRLVTRSQSDFIDAGLMLINPSE